MRPAAYPQTGSRNQRQSESEDDDEYEDDEEEMDESMRSAIQFEMMRDRMQFAPGRARTGSGEWGGSQTSQQGSEHGSDMSLESQMSQLSDTMKTTSLYADDFDEGGGSQSGPPGCSNQAGRQKDPSVRSPSDVGDVPLRYSIFRLYMSAMNTHSPVFFVQSHG